MTPRSSHSEQVGGLLAQVLLAEVASGVSEHCRDYLHGRCGDCPCRCHTDVASEVAS